MHLHGTGGNIDSSICRFTDLNFILPNPACNSFGALERTVQVIFNQKSVHNKNLRLICFCGGVTIIPKITIFSTDKDTCWTTDLITNVHYQIN